uniref:Uncharacterized protein n=1 Tax=Megaviridae environmental sample TaxID=1737588 RepID=A0A5J6VJY2_9VIRU|nr:MAG: hypothetical protein [Megaviridae environmental sample]
MCGITTIWIMPKYAYLGYIVIQELSTYILINSSPSNHDSFSQFTVLLGILGVFGFGVYMCVLNREDGIRFLGGAFKGYIIRCIFEGILGWFEFTPETNGYTGIIYLFSTKIILDINDLVNLVLELKWTNINFMWLFQRDACMQEWVDSSYTFPLNLNTIIFGWCPLFIGLSLGPENHLRIPCICTCVVSMILMHYVLRLRISIFVLSLRYQDEIHARKTLALLTHYRWAKKLDHRAKKLRRKRLFKVVLRLPILLKRLQLETAETAYAPGGSGYVLAEHNFNRLCN